MSNDYPTSRQLKEIEKWEGTNFLEFIELVRSAWNHVVSNIEKQASEFMEYAGIESNE